MKNIRWIPLVGGFIVGSVVAQLIMRGSTAVVIVTLASVAVFAVVSLIWALRD